jgi:O-antigen/teichoic acid export membrane protein
MISGKLIKSSFIYTVIGALPLISAFFLLIFYTNYLTRADYGAFVIYISFTALVQVLINLGLDGYIGVIYFQFRQNSDTLKAKFGLITGVLLLWGVFIMLMGLILGENLFSLIFHGKDIFFYPFGLMSVVTAFFNSFFKTYTNLLINQEKASRFAVVNIANFAMTIGFSLTGLFLYPYTLIGPIWGRFLSGAGIFLIALISFLKESRFTSEVSQQVKQILRYSMPIMIYLIISWSISSIYPFILKQYIGLAELAIFGLAVQFTLLVDFFLNGLSNAIAPKVYALIIDNNLDHSTPELNKYLSGFNAIALLIIPAATFIIPVALPFLINKDYEESFLLLAALNIGFATRGLYNYFLNPIYLLKKTKVLPVAYVATAVVQVILLVVLIKYFGIWGAVITSLLTKIVQNLFLYLVSRSFFRYEFNRFKFVWLPLIITMVILASEYFISMHNMHLVRLLQLVFTYFIVWIFYRKEITTLLQTLKFRLRTNK